MEREEVVAGLDKALDIAGVRALVDKYSPLWREGNNQAEILRPRIARGKAWLAENPGGDQEAGKVRIAELEAQLREAEGKVMLGLAFALAEAFGEALARSDKYPEWKPPKGSKLRVILPGILNLGVALDDSEAASRKEHH
jgi:hypothetical protein